MIVVLLVVIVVILLASVMLLGFGGIAVLASLAPKPAPRSDAGLDLRRRIR